MINCLFFLISSCSRASSSSVRFFSAIHAFSRSSDSAPVAFSTARPITSPRPSTLSCEMASCRYAAVLPMAAAAAAAAAAVSASRGPPREDACASGTVTQEMAAATSGGDTVASAARRGASCPPFPPLPRAPPRRRRRRQIDIEVVVARHDEAVEQVERVDRVAVREHVLEDERVLREDRLGLRRRRRVERAQAVVVAADEVDGARPAPEAGALDRVDAVLEPHELVLLLLRELPKPRAADGLDDAARDAPVGGLAAHRAAGSPLGLLFRGEDERLRDVLEMVAPIDGGGE